jgi:RNA polymerase sigma-70 factor (ECF subfamily)
MDDEFVAFCRREHGRLVAALDLVTGSLPLAEDLAQEALARAFKSWSRIRRLDSPGGYVHRMAINMAMSSFRRRAAERRAQARAGIDHEQTTNPDTAIAIAVRSALDGLRVEQRRVLVLRYFLGFSVDETAELLRMPTGTVKTHTTRGLAALRTLLDEPLTVDGVEVARA